MGKFKSDIVVMKRIYRWDIYYCSLDQDIANTDSCLIGKPNRPCLIVSDNDYNRDSKKVIVMPFCSCNIDNMSPEDYVEVEKERGTIVIPMVLNRDKHSFLMISQPRSIYQRMLQEYVGTLDINANPGLADKIDEYIFKMMIDEDVFIRSKCFERLIGKYISQNKLSNNNLDESFGDEEIIDTSDDVSIDDDIKEFQKETVTKEEKEEIAEEKKDNPELMSCDPISLEELIYKLSNSFADEFRGKDGRYSMYEMAKAVGLSYIGICGTIAEQEKIYINKF